MPKSVQAQRRRQQQLRAYGLGHQTSSVAARDGLRLQQVNAGGEHRALAVGRVTERIEADARMAGHHVQVARRIGVKKWLGASCRSETCRVHQTKGRAAHRSDQRNEECRRQHRRCCAAPGLALLQSLGRGTHLRFRHRLLRGRRLGLDH
eukprot:scaffold55329_cov63-Phaeocystis_antarctica.AAC.2